MARQIAEGYTTVSWARGGDFGAWDLAANLSTLAFPDGRTVWDEFCARHGLSENAAAPGRAGTLVEFAAWASTEQEFFARCTRPWLQGFLSPGGQGWIVCPRALRSNDRRALLAMWRQAGWPKIRLVGPTPTTLFGGFAARQVGPSVGRAHAPGPATATMTRCFGCLEPPIRVLEWSSRRAPLRPGPTIAGTTTWLVWGPGPGWCTALAAKERRTQSPSAGGA